MYLKLKITNLIHNYANNILGSFLFLFLASCHLSFFFLQEHTKKRSNDKKHYCMKHILQMQARTNFWKNMCHPVINTLSIQLPFFKGYLHWTQELFKQCSEVTVLKCSQYICSKMLSEFTEKHLRLSFFKKKDCITVVFCKFGETFQNKDFIKTSGQLINEALLKRNGKCNTLTVNL